VCFESIRARRDAAPRELGCSDSGLRGETGMKRLGVRSEIHARACSLGARDADGTCKSLAVEAE
jgi:hypothetical protein